MESSPEVADQPELHDVLIIGAGPCGLAMASRLREDTPSAMFTDEEQQRYTWIKKHHGRMSIKNKRTLATKSAYAPASATRGLSLVVLDEAGDQWLSQWHRLFHLFEISHLRSPMFFHVDPRDRDGLLGYTHEQERADELIEIGGCVGQERSKHQRKKDRGGKRGFHEPAIDERDRKDYFTPSTPLFKCHCEDVSKKYGLEQGLIKQESVKDIDHDYFEQVSDIDKTFKVVTSQRTWYAKIVVLAVGAGNMPHLPEMPGAKAIQGACHAMHIKHFPDPVVQQRIKLQQTTCVVVVGGGLTAAHLAANALRKGVHQVHLITRGDLKVKPFDVDLSWMGKFRNLQLASFWSADTDQERWEQIRTARGGGSITPRIAKVLKSYTDAGRLHIHNHTTVCIPSSSYCAAAARWTTLATSPAIPALHRLGADYVYHATGTPSDFSTLPYLRTLRDRYPVQGIGGLPCLTHDMAWAEGVPLFVTGKLAGLRLGPGAGNLAGARTGAERIAWSVQEDLERSSGGGGVGRRREGMEKGEEGDDGEGEAMRYHLGIGNKFHSLELVDSATG